MLANLFTCVVPRPDKVFHPSSLSKDISLTSKHVVWGPYSIPTYSLTGIQWLGIKQNLCQCVDTHRIAITYLSPTIEWTAECVYVSKMIQRSNVFIYLFIENAIIFTVTKTNYTQCVLIIFVYTAQLGIYYRITTTLWGLLSKHLMLLVIHCKKLIFYSLKGWLLSKGSKFGGWSPAAMISYICGKMVCLSLFYLTFKRERNYICSI